MARRKTKKSRKAASETKPTGSRQSHGQSPKRQIGPILLVSIVILAAVIAGSFIFKARKERADAQVIETVKIEMEQGTIVIQVYPKLMPVTVENFLDLAGSGFYDGLIWHRVENWVVQTGDPEGTGMGGSGKTIKLETNKNLKNVRGAVAMARSQARDSASSQFYVLKTDAPWLDGDYAVFGKVVSGMEIIDSLKAGDTMLRVKVEPK
jgi:peptidyl-prolyl cis-trans isomerase B (cyclophilin B)